MQIAKRLDPVTVGKIVRSAEIAAAGFMAAFIPIMSKEFYDYVTAGAAIDWRAPVGAGFAAVGAWLYNAVKEWLRGASPEPHE